MPRKATGQLVWKASGWHGRFWSLIDGERVRVCVKLDTTHKPVAKIKLARLVAEADAAATATTTATRATIARTAKRNETFSEACERVYLLREAAGLDITADLPLLRRIAFEVIGHLDVAVVETGHVNTIFDSIQAAGLELASAHRMRYALRAVFKQLKREGLQRVCPTVDASFPVYEKKVGKERAVLSDAEFEAYLSWEGTRRYATFEFERKVMSCVSRMFGGLRISDITALRWESLDSESGQFAWGFAPRQKTKRPQRLEIPEQLRPVLREWWQREGKKTSGLVFAARYGATAGEQRKKFSCAVELRRDLMAAFEAHGTPRRGSRRWTELFTETEFTKPVDFHSFRRAFCQGLADAEVSAQTAATLAGHSSLKTHSIYLRNADRARSVPEAALPKLVSIKALGLGTTKEKVAKTTATPFDALAEASMIFASLRGSVEWSLRGEDNGTPGFSGVSGEEKALSVPEPDSTTVVRDSRTTIPPVWGAQVVALPAGARVDVIDLLRAIDVALLRGEPHRARRLVAAVLRAMGADDRAVGGDDGDVAAE